MLVVCIYICWFIYVYMVICVRVYKKGFKDKLLLLITNIQEYKIFDTSQIIFLRN